MLGKLTCLGCFVLVLGLTAGAAGGLELKINFQRQGGDIPEGYLPDYGEVFGDRGQGFSYGWDVDIQDDARERGRSFDQLYDTLVQMQEGDPRTWEIELPNGGYDVFVACGDPSYKDQVNTIDVEGNILTDPDGPDNFDEYSVIAIVSDGRLTIKPAPGGTKCKIMFANIKGISIFKAHSPVPDDDSVYLETAVNLSWSPGDFAASHDVYFGESLDDVNDGTAGTFRGNQAATEFVVGFPGSPYPDGLVPGTTYYWRIDEVNDANVASPWKGQVWSFAVPPLIAYSPDPPDGAEFVYLDATLGWTSGLGAQSHTVYIGDNFGDVNDAAEGAAQTATTYTPEALEKGTVYYWRVDESDGVTTHKGDIWSFATIPIVPITDPNLLCWWKFDEIFGESIVDYSGYDNFGTAHGASLELNGRVGGALYFGGDGDYVVDEDAEDYLNGLSALTVCMWIKSEVINTDKGFLDCEQPDGSDQMVTMRYDQQGSTFGGRNVLKMAVTSAPPNWEQQLESSGYLQTTEWQHVAMTWSSGEVIRFYVDGAEDMPTGTSDPNDAGGTVTGCTKLIIGKAGKDQGTTSGWKGLIDDVRIYNIVLTEDEVKQVMRGESDLAWDPSPANGSTPDIKNALPLTWLPGENALEHDVYFGTDRDAVTSCDTSDTTGVYRGRQDLTSYVPAEDVGWGTGPYYWRVDEYNTDGTITKGRIWFFTVADFILVDDFEHYNIDDNQIWHAWNDGVGYSAWRELPAYSGNGTGSAAGDESTFSYTEEHIVHTGGQSMPYWYDNNNPDKFKYSEAKMTLTGPRDWSEEGLKALTLWFRGYPTGFKEQPAGTYAMSALGTDISGMADEFRFAYKRLSGAGSIEAQVLSVQDTGEWAKAGVMIRRTLDPSSLFAAVYITPGNGCRFQGRLALGTEASSDTPVATPEQKAITAPYWIRIERDGSDNFSGYYSSDGVTWQAMTWNPQNITMPTDVYIGLALTSHNVNAVCKAQFSDVKTTGSVSPATWTHEAIGAAMPSNDPEPLYVAVANSTGSPVVVYHDDPNAAQIDTWTEWNIDLKDFADQGVNLTDVNSIAIGFGDRDNPAAGGAGKMYFDDIRLYRPRCVPDKVTLSAADLNSDCVVDMADVEIMVGDWLTAEPDLAADLNADSSVDLKDYAILADQWGSETVWPEW